MMICARQRDSRATESDIVMASSSLVTRSYGVLEPYDELWLIDKFEAVIA